MKQNSSTNGNLENACTYKDISTIDFSDFMQCENDNDDWLTNTDLLSLDFDEDSINELLYKLEQICNDK